MCTQELKIGTIPAVLYGEPAPNIWLFVHGQGGNKTEAAAFAALAAPTGWQVLGIDLPEHGDRTGETDFTPWQVVPELQTVLAYVKRVVATMGEALLEGRVEAAPHLKNRSACRYCPYSPVCGKEFTAKDVELDKTTPQQALEKMRETLEKGGNTHG